MRVELLFVCVLLGVALSQQVGLEIDDFSLGANTQRCSVTLSSELNTSMPPIVQTDSMSFPGCSEMVGCERDMEVKVFSGYTGRTFDSDIFLISNGYFVGEWAAAAPKSSSSLFTLQYDGMDGSMNLDLNGLDNLNLAQYGDTLQIAIVSDLNIVMDYTFYSPNGAACEYHFSVPGIIGSYDYSDTIYAIPFSHFSGSCSFNNIGAIEVSTSFDDAADVLTRQIAVIQTGTPPPPSPSASPLPPKPPGTPVQIIDDFTSGADSQSIVAILSQNIKENQPPIYYNSTYSKPNCVGLLGCGRDMMIKVEEGNMGEALTSGVYSDHDGYFPAEWIGSCPRSTLGFFVLQYDGMDNSTFLDLGGLGGIDLTTNGTGTHLRLVVVSDVDTSVTVNLFSSFGGVCFFDFVVEYMNYGYSNAIYDIPLNDISGSCDIHNIGAIEIFISFDSGTDMAIEQILTVTN